MLSFLPIALFVASTSAAVARYRGGPVNTTRVCDKVANVPSGDYTLINNLATISPAPSGYQCCKIDTRDNSSIAWTADFQWAVGTGVYKGFSFAQQNKGAFQRINQIGSMPSVWNYALTTASYNNLTFNVAYALAATATPVAGAAHTTEIAVWVSSNQAAPVSDTRDSSGIATPTVKQVSLGGYAWAIYKGTRSGIPVYTFVNLGATSALQVSFNVDVYLLVKYLSTNGAINGNHYLSQIQAGTNVITASATTLKTTYFNIDVNPIPSTPPGVNWLNPLCGYDDNATTPDASYTVFNNQWGALAAIRKGTTVGLGGGCSQIKSLPDSSSIAWNTNYAWYNGSTTKGYPCVQLNTGAGTQLSKIASIPSTWNYQVSQQGHTWNLDYNVAYDFFTGSTPNITVGSPKTNEIMIWTNVHYMVPVTVRDPTTNKPVYLAQKLRLPGINGNYSWTLYGGKNGEQNVYTFVNEYGWQPDNSLPPVSWSQDMWIFFKYLLDKKYIASTDYLNVLQAGSEDIRADNATVATSYFNMKVNLVPGSVTSSPSAFPANWAFKTACVTDKASPNSYLSTKTVQSAMTPTTCVILCNNNGFAYAGLEGGNQCWCGNSLNTAGGAGVATTGCNIACPGDSTKNCGGTLKLELFAKTTGTKASVAASSTKKTSSSVKATSTAKKARRSLAL